MRSGIVGQGRQKARWGNLNSSSRLIVQRGAVNHLIGSEVRNIAKPRRTVVGGGRRCRMEGAAVLRQLLGETEELWDFYERRWSLFDFYGSSFGDDYCSIILDEKSEILNMLDANMIPSKRSRGEKSGRRLFILPNFIDAMEQEIWKELPEDLFEVVIARLPIATFFRFRTVCQKWNSLLTSGSFSQHLAEVNRMNPWFCTIVHDTFHRFDTFCGVAMYDPSLKKWHHPSIPVLRSKKITLTMASVGGLVCLLDINNRYFYICNPLTNSVKELPPRSVHVCSRVAVGMVLTENTNCDYKVVWLGCNGDNEIYDSVHNSWTRQGSLPQCIKHPLFLNFRSHTVRIGSTLYFMRANPDGILTYDAATGVWKQFIIPLPLHISNHSLAECGGNVMLVGLLCKNAATCVCIWELQKMTLLWKEVDRMPNISCLEYYGKHVKMTCMGNQGMLLLSLRSRGTNRFITYDMCKKEWQKVPDCSLPLDGRKVWVSCGITFYPCPAAHP